MRDPRVCACLLNIHSCMYNCQIRLNGGISLVRKTKAEAAATREAILNAAVNVFADQGVGKASLEQVAKSAGVTRGAVYWHFKNKIDIFQALYDQLYLPFSEMVLSDLKQEHPRPLEQLATLCARLFCDLARNPAKQRILTLFFLRCDFSGEMDRVRQAQNARKAQSFRLFRQYFERAQVKGQLPDDADPHVLTMVLLSFITGVTYEFLRNPTVFDLAKYGKAMFDTFFNGLTRA